MAFYKSRFATSTLLVMGGSAIALTGVVIFYGLREPAHSAPVRPIPNAPPKWEFQSTRDALTDETYTSIRLAGEEGLALLAVRCEKMIDVNGSSVPIYTLQVATSDFLGETELFQPRSAMYRLGQERAVREDWVYSDRNAEQDGPKSENEVLRRLDLVNQITNGKALLVRLKTYRYEDRDYSFEGNDPNGSNRKLLAECSSRPKRR